MEKSRVVRRPDPDRAHMFTVLFYFIDYLLSLPLLKLKVEEQKTP